jgi:molybdopterin converting factor small subunit
MNSLNILYFGSIRDITGISTETVSHSGTLQEILNDLKIRYPGIQGTRFQVSLNRRIIQPEDMNSIATQPLEGDEIALLPPFAGG